jgi:hypothetical protein
MAFKFATSPYDFGDIVYLRCRPDKLPGMVTAIHLMPGATSFGVTWGDEGRETTHYAFELTGEYLPDFSTL